MVVFWCLLFVVLNETLTHCVSLFVLFVVFFGCVDSYKSEYMPKEYGDIEVKYLSKSDFSERRMWLRKIWYFTPWWFRVYLYRSLFGILIFYILCKAEYGFCFWLSCLWSLMWSLIWWFVSWIPWFFSWIDWSLIFWPDLNVDNTTKIDL